MNRGFLKTVDALTDLALVSPDPNYPFCYVSAMGGIYHWNPAGAATPDSYNVNSLLPYPGQWTFAGLGGFGFYMGTGNPEGVQIASPPSFFWDATNRVLYIKTTGAGTNTGWVELLA